MSLESLEQISADEYREIENSAYKIIAWSIVVTCVLVASVAAIIHYA